MNPPHRPSFLEEPKDISAIKNIYLETNSGNLDVITLEDHLGPFEDLKSRALKVSLFKHDCLVLSLDDLIRVKEKMKRPKDLIVLEELRAIKKLNR